MVRLKPDTTHMVRLKPDATNRGARRAHHGQKDGAGNGIRTRDFDLGKVALYH